MSRVSIIMALLFGLSIQMAVAQQPAQKQQVPRSSAGSGAIDCGVDLKPTDTFKELTAKLKCLQDRIRTLEQTRSALGSAITPHTATKENRPPIPSGTSTGWIVEVVERPMHQDPLKEGMWTFPVSGSAFNTAMHKKIRNIDNAVGFRGRSKFNATEAGKFTFVMQVNSSPSCFVWMSINGKVIINQDSVSGQRDVYGSIDLTVGQHKTDFVFSCGDNRDSSRMEIQIKSPSEATPRSVSATEFVL